MDLRGMILAMVDEPLVLVVKLADRLHNMRTVYALRPDRQRTVAAETTQVWCSLAERLGLFSLKVRSLFPAFSTATFAHSSTSLRVGYEALSSRSLP
jgi:(p)ppGpp synthase/HD superfamily hydrolase